MHIAKVGQQMVDTIARQSVCSDVWYGMVEVCEGAPVAVSGWVLTDRHDLSVCVPIQQMVDTIARQSVCSDVCVPIQQIVRHGVYV